MCILAYGKTDTKNSILLNCAIPSFKIFLRHHFVNYHKINKIIIHLETGSKKIKLFVEKK